MNYTGTPQAGAKFSSLFDCSLCSLFGYVLDFNFLKREKMRESGKGVWRERER